MPIFAHKIHWISTALLLFTITTHASSYKDGKQSSSLCAGCHGTTGLSTSDEYPNLAGQREAYLIKQLKAFRSNERKDPTMNAIAKTLSDQKIANLANYFSQQQLHVITANLPVAELTSKVEIKNVDQYFSKPTYVSLKKDKTVTALHQHSTWEGGPNMLFNAISPNGKMLLVTSPSTDSVYIFNTQTGQQLAIVPVGKSPKGVKITPNGKFAYISNQSSDNISVVSLASLKVVSTIETPAGPHNVRFSANGETGYVTLQGGAGLGVIDIDSQRVVKVIPIRGITGPHNIDLSQDEKLAFVRDIVGHVAVVDIAREITLKIIKVGKGHAGIDVIPNGQYAITAAIADNYITVIDSQDLSVVKNIDLGASSHGIRASLDSKWLYVSLTKANQIAVVDLQDLTLTAKINVGQLPFWISVIGNP